MMRRIRFVAPLSHCIFSGKWSDNTKNTNRYNSHKKGNRKLIKPQITAYLQSK